MLGCSRRILITPLGLVSKGKTAKPRTIRIRIKDKMAARCEALEIARRLDAGERDPRWAQEVLTFHNIDSLRSVLIDERLELLRLIHTEASKLDH